MKTFSTRRHSLFFTSSWYKPMAGAYEWCKMCAREKCTYTHTSVNSRCMTSQSYPPVKWYKHRLMSKGFVIHASARWYARAPPPTPTPISHLHTLWCTAAALHHNAHIQTSILCPPPPSLSLSLLPSDSYLHLFLPAAGKVWEYYHLCGIMEVWWR